MRRNSIVPTLALGLLTVLAAGAVALGLLFAPATPDLVVHNGAGETLLAPSLTAFYSSVRPTKETVRIEYRAPDHLTETLLAAGPGSRPVRSRILTGSSAVKALQPFDQLQQITGFTPVGSGFVAHRSASTLVPASESLQVSGTVTYDATVSGGSLVGITESYHVTTPIGTEHGVFHYLVTSIGGQPVAVPRG